MINRFFGRSALVMLVAASLCAPVAAANNFGVLDKDGNPVTKCSIQQSDSSQADCAEMLNGKPVKPNASFTAPAGTTVYSAGQLIANSATAGSVTPLSLTACRNNGNSGTLWGAHVYTTDSGFSNQSVLVKLYESSPTVANGDHAAWSTTRSGYIGTVAVTFDQPFTDNSGTYEGRGVLLTGSLATYVCQGGSTQIYALVVANSSITPVGGKAFTVIAEVTEN